MRQIFLYQTETHFLFVSNNVNWIGPVPYNSDQLCVLKVETTFTLHKKFQPFFYELNYRHVHNIMYIMQKLV